MQNRPQALVLAPTRELAIQVKEDIFHIGRYKRINVPVLFGRSPFYKQVQALKQKTHIVVGTPWAVCWTIWNVKHWIHLLSVILLW